MNTSRSKKKISVIIPNYNYGKYIRSRIRSILRQTYPIYEIIILDDCSTDGSDEMARSIVLDLNIQRPDMNIKFLPSEENSGKAMAQWKKGFELATGDFIWIAEADDLCSRRFLEEVMKGFDDHEVVLSYTESMIIDGRGLVIAPNFRWSRDREKTGHYKKNYINNGVREVEEIMAIRCTIPNVSAVVFKNTSNVPYLQYLDEAMRYTQVGDWYFYVKVLSHGKIAYNHKALNRFRLHKGSVTSNAKRAVNHYDEVLEMHKFITKKYNVSECVTRRMLDEEKRLLKRVEK